METIHSPSNTDTANDSPVLWVSTLTDARDD